MLAAGWAGAFPLVSGLGPHRSWGLCAAAGYLAAAVAVLVLPRRWARAGSVAVALLGAVLVPLLVLVVGGQGQSEVAVIERSGELLLRHGTPYLAEPRTVAEYTPYLPGMALFGLPRALFGADGWPARVAGDARLWCAAAFLGCLAAAVLPTRRRAGRPGPTAARRATVTAARTGALPAALPTAALVASPVVALPLCVSGVDLPLTGLCVLALALAGRARPVTAGWVLALACALKWTAWPAVAVVVALLAATSGRRAALRAAVTAAAGTAALVLPCALRSPGPLLRQVFAFPTGRGDLPTPASSPLPGRLLADLGPAGWYAALALLLLAGAAVARSLVRRPPRDTRAAADRLALGLALAFLLAPAGRFGYLALPALLVLLPRLSRLPGFPLLPHLPRRSRLSRLPFLSRPHTPRPHAPQVVPAP
ncbi:glycosyltransferase 87 family protein [Kitasatospora purpeofusca]|uniref:glycosyltransferase 87 family protein n=1 Tax=Kitasatospora purpeofusca TaxID=67352 RepID=UPI002A59D4AE|nr:glycosyltransferase 87 family protein [Kitasatospora purpeofusca]MDY0812412.1 glycosyltransferase 87 family protein [Kitasatospora purpeofusca]